MSDQITDNAKTLEYISSLLKDKSTDGLILIAKTTIFICIFIVSVRIISSIISYYYPSINTNFINFKSSIIPFVILSLISTYYSINSLIDAYNSSGDDFSTVLVNYAAIFMFNSFVLVGIYYCKALTEKRFFEAEENFLKFLFYMIFSCFSFGISFYCLLMLMIFNSLIVKSIFAIFVIIMIGFYLIFIINELLDLWKNLGKTKKENK